MFFSQRGLPGLSLAIVMAVAGAQAQQPAIQNDVDTPITVLAKGSKTFTEEQKFRIYQDCVNFYLDNVRKNHPNLLAALTDYLNTPQAAYDGESRGFHNFKASIEYRIEKSKTDGIDPSKINALTVVVASGNAYLQSLRSGSVK